MIRPCPLSWLMQRQAILGPSTFVSPPAEPERFPLDSSESGLSRDDPIGKEVIATGAGPMAGRDKREWDS